MGIFSNPSDKYSQERHYFPLQDFVRIFRDLNVKSLSREEEELVARELDSLRSRDGKLSMRDVYKVIYSLKNQNKISKIDEKILLPIFENYFSKFDK